MYCVLCIVVFVYRTILCIGVVAGDGGMLQVVCCSFYDSITWPPAAASPLSAQIVYHAAAAELHEKSH